MPTTANANKNDCKGEFLADPMHHQHFMNSIYVLYGLEPFNEENYIYTIGAFAMTIDQHNCNRQLHMNILWYMVDVYWVEHAHGAGLIEDKLYGELQESIVFGLQTSIFTEYCETYPFACTDDYILTVSEILENESQTPSPESTRSHF